MVTVQRDVRVRGVCILKPLRGACASKSGGYTPSLGESSRLLVHTREAHLTFPQDSGGGRNSYVHFIRKVLYIMRLTSLGQLGKGEVYRSRVRYFDTPWGHAERIQPWHKRHIRPEG